MATKSNYFGYTQRMPGTAWVLSPLPIPSNALYTTTVTGDIAVNGIIALSSTSINQIGGTVNSDGTFSLPVGLYRIKFQTTVTGTAEIVVGLHAGSTTVVEVTEPEGTATISGETLISCSGCDIKWGIYNDSTAALATEMMGSYSCSVIIEKIY